MEKAQHAWGWLQQFVKDAGEYVGAHILSMVRAHYPLIDLSCLEGGYPKEVGPRRQMTFVSVCWTCRRR